METGPSDFVDSSVLMRFRGILLCSALGALFTWNLLSAWWRHQMETFSALLAICAGNWPVTFEFPSQSQWPRALMFSLICAWINGEAGDFRRHRAHYDVTIMYMNWKLLLPHLKKTSWHGNPFRVTGPLSGGVPVTGGVILHRASNEELWCFSLLLARTSYWTKRKVAGDLIRHAVHVTSKGILFIFTCQSSRNSLWY